MEIMKTIELCKGDSISLECDIDTDITGWEIRAEIFDDCNHCIKLATANVTGGSDDQIIITDVGTKSTFLISVAKDRTTCFETESKIEIEAVTGTDVGGETEKKTLFKGRVLFQDEEITWDNVPS